MFLLKNVLQLSCLLIALLTNNVTLACDCDLGSVDDKVNNAESVFLGKVRSVNILGEKNSLGENRIIVEFDVTIPFKGSDSPITLDTFDNTVSCEGYWFKKGKEYLVYTYEVEERLSTFYCGGVLPKNLQKESIFLKELNKLKHILGDGNNK